MFDYKLGASNLNELLINNAQINANLSVLRQQAS